MTLLPHVHRLRSWFLLRPRFWAWVGVVALILLAVRIALPFVLCRAVNDRLAKVEGYAGSVDDIDLQLFRGAYLLKGVTILTREDEVVKPFFTAELVDFSLAWRELVRGRLVSDIFLVAPKMHITKEATPVDTREEGRRWQEVIQDVFPIEITQLEISRGELHFVDRTSTPVVDVSIRQLHTIATGLRNRPSEGSGPNPAVISADAVTIGDGRISLFAQGDPLAAQPRFNIKVDVQGVHLPALNDFLEAYAGVDVSAGVFNLYVEMNAADGAFEGYLKPFIQDVKFTNVSDSSKGPLRQLWETLVSGVSTIMKNDDSEKVATRVPFSGKFGETQVGVWETIATLIRNGFGRALFEGRDDEPPPTQASVNISEQ